MNTEDMRHAVQVANNTLAAADNVANDLARLLVGRLRRVSPYRLEQLKRELKNFNIHTGRWMR
jgi:hypothetical protein